MSAITPEVVKELLNTPAGRRALSKASPEFFDTYYCGMRAARHRTTWLDAFDDLVTSTKDTNRKGRLLVMAPRGHGKTEACASSVTRQICLNREVKILWIAEASTSAIKRVARVRALLKSPRIVEDWCSAPEEGYGPFFDGPLCKDTDALVIVDRKTSPVDGTLEAVGSGGGVTGGHPDIIVSDDLEDDRTTNTLQLRQATRTWWNGTIEPMLGPGGVVFMVGTRKHNDDLYGHIKRNASWKVLEDPAIKRWPSEWEYQIEADEFGRKTLAGVTYSDDYEVLWPEERGLEFLLLECRYGKELEFAREYQHQVQDDSRAVFRMDWLNAAKQRGVGMVLYGERPAGLGKLRIVQAWDLALVTDRKMAEQLDRDYTVGVTWASDDQGNRYLLGMFRERGLTPLELRNAVISEYRRFGGEVAEIVIERNNFGNLHYMGLVQSTDLPVRAHTTTGSNKTDPFKGVPAMGHLFEADKVWLPTGDEFSRRMVDVLCTELWGLGKERHDDAVMALWIAEFRLREHGFGHQIIINGRDLTGAGGGDEGSSRVSRYGPSPEDHGEGRDTSEVLESWPLYGW